MCWFDKNLSSPGILWTNTISSSNLIKRDQARPTSPNIPEMLVPNESRYVRGYYKCIPIGKQRLNAVEVAGDQFVPPTKLIKDILK